MRSKRACPSLRRCGARRVLVSQSAACCAVLNQANAHAGAAAAGACAVFAKRHHVARPLPAQPRARAVFCWLRNPRGGMRHTRRRGGVCSACRPNVLAAVTSSFPPRAAYYKHLTRASPAWRRGSPNEDPPQASAAAGRTKTASV
jgi:hypothetical protein